MVAAAKKIICIIDDDPLFRYVTQRLIERIIKDYELIQFENGALAIEFFRNSIHKISELPQLIFLDINMPILNGWGFLNEFVSMEKGSYWPVIYMSSSSCDHNDIELAGSYKVLHGYLMKPLSPVKITSIIEEVFGSAS